MKSNRNLNPSKEKIAKVDYLIKLYERVTQTIKSYRQQKANNISIQLTREYPISKD